MRERYARFAAGAVDRQDRNRSLDAPHEAPWRQPAAPYAGPTSPAAWDRVMAELVATDPDTRAMLGIGQRRLVP